VSQISDHPCSPQEKTQHAFANSAHASICKRVSNELCALFMKGLMFPEYLGAAIDVQQNLGVFLSI